MTVGLRVEEREREGRRQRPVFVRGGFLAAGSLRLEMGEEREGRQQQALGACCSRLGGCTTI